MQKIRNVFLLTIALGTVFSFTQKPTNTRNPIVQGVVVAGNTGKPLSHVHVYIVHGEEEALTNSKGEFSIETSRKFPLTITAEREGFHRYQGTVSSPGQRQTIKLQSK